MVPSLLPILLPLLPLLTWGSLQPGLWGCGAIVCPSVPSVTSCSSNPSLSGSAAVASPASTTVEGRGKDRGEGKSEPRALRERRLQPHHYRVRERAKRARVSPLGTSSKQRQGWARTQAPLLPSVHLSPPQN